MIYFKPVFLDDEHLKIKFEAIENDVASGSCLLTIDGNKATVESLDGDEDKLYIVDGLIKSAFNYATIKNCYMGYCKCDKFSAFLDKMSFEKQDGVYFNDIPTILQGNCCKKQ